MIGIIITLNELWIDNSISNRILDYKTNTSITNDKKIFSTSINFWLIDSKIYELFLLYKTFTLNVRYFDFGSFNYQNEIPNDNQTFTFSPFSIYFSLGKKFKVEEKLFLGLNFGYYENRVIDEIKASPFISISSNFKLNSNNSILFSFENFSFKKLIYSNQVELPQVLSLALSSNMKQFEFAFGFNKYNNFEKFLAISYSLREILKFGILLTPDYDYSKFSGFLIVKYRKLNFGYKAYIPTYLNFTNTISISYETP
jgi:hypothetical protein